MTNNNEQRYQDELQDQRDHEAFLLREQRRRQSQPYAQGPAQTRTIKSQLFQRGQNESNTASSCIFQLAYTNGCTRPTCEESHYEHDAGTMPQLKPQAQQFAQAQNRDIQIKPRPNSPFGQPFGRPRTGSGDHSNSGGNKKPRADGRSRTPSPHRDKDPHRGTRGNLKHSNG